MYQHTIAQATVTCLHYLGIRRHYSTSLQVSQNLKCLADAEPLPSTDGADIWAADILTMLFAAVFHSLLAPRRREAAQMFKVLKELEAAGDMELPAS